VTTPSHNGTTPGTDRAAQQHDTAVRTPGSGVAGATTLATEAPLLEGLGLTVRYGGVYALNEVDLTVAPGEYCGLIGPNGAGKTTLFDIISGHRPATAGTLRLAGDDISGHSAVWRARNGVRRTFQRQQVFGALTVADNVMAGLDWRGGEGGFLADVVGLPIGRRQRAERRERTSEVLELCGLAEVADAYAGNLPIGAARLVELARAIVDPPKLLLLDEPTSGLSHEQTERLGAVVDHVRGDSGCAVMLVEHDVGFVMNHCDRVVCLNLGQVLATGTPAEIQANPAVRQAYLG
jgi:branched-chain amino acid transport system ATP-binding protein